MPNPYEQLERELRRFMQEITQVNVLLDNVGVKPGPIEDRITEALEFIHDSAR